MTVDVKELLMEVDRDVTCKVAAQMEIANLQDLHLALVLILVDSCQKLEALGPEQKRARGVVSWMKHQLRSRSNKHTLFLALAAMLPVHMRLLFNEERMEEAIDEYNKFRPIDAWFELLGKHGLKPWQSA